MKMTCGHDNKYEILYKGVKICKVCENGRYSSIRLLSGMKRFSESIGALLFVVFFAFSPIIFFDFQTRILGRKEIGLDNLYWQLLISASTFFSILCSIILVQFLIFLWKNAFRSKIIFTFPVSILSFVLDCFKILNYFKELY